MDAAAIFYTAKRLRYNCRIAVVPGEVETHTFNTNDSFDEVKAITRDLEGPVERGTDLPSRAPSRGQISTLKYRGTIESDRGEG